MLPIIATRTYSSGSTKSTTLRWHFAVEEIPTFFPSFYPAMRMDSTTQGRNFPSQPPQWRFVPRRVKVMVIRRPPLPFSRNLLPGFSLMRAIGFWRCVTFRGWEMSPGLRRLCCCSAPHDTTAADHGNGSAQAE